jgi:ribosome biogenesis GTPase A
MERKERNMFQAPLGEPKNDTYLRQSRVHLVSCKNGYGFYELLRDVMDLARTNGNTVYVLGSANVGKSSFINQLVFQAQQKSRTRKFKQPTATVSPLPGTTLGFLKIRLPNGVTLIDTPGIINQAQITTWLTNDELKAVIPTKRVKPVTIRIAEGKCVLLGGLARVEVSEGRPFLFTFFVSPEVKLHPTAIDTAFSFAQKHIGALLSPPFDLSRLSALPMSKTHEFTIIGDGWKKSTSDIVISGLGWFSVTGVGVCKVRVHTLEHVQVTERSALLPYETWENAATFTGGKLQSAPKPTRKRRTE